MSEIFKAERRTHPLDLAGISLSAAAQIGDPERLRALADKLLLTQLQHVHGDVSKRREDVMRSQLLTTARDDLEEPAAVVAELRAGYLRSHPFAERIVAVEAVTRSALAWYDRASAALADQLGPLALGSGPHLLHPLPAEIDLVDLDGAVTEALTQAGAEFVEDSARKAEAELDAEAAAYDYRDDAERADIEEQARDELLAESGQYEAIEDMITDRAAERHPEIHRQFMAEEIEGWPEWLRKECETEFFAAPEWKKRLDTKMGAILIERRAVEDLTADLNEAAPLGGDLDFDAESSALFDERSAARLAENAASNNSLNLALDAAGELSLAAADGSSLDARGLRLVGTVLSPTGLLDLPGLCVDQHGKVATPPAVALFGQRIPKELDMRPLAPIPREVFAELLPLFSHELRYSSASETAVLIGYRPSEDGAGEFVLIGALGERPVAEDSEDEA